MEAQQEIEKETGTYIIPVPQAKIAPFHIPRQSTKPTKERKVKEWKHKK